MNEKENVDTRKILGTIVGILLFSGIILFFTYAWYEWRSENTNVALSIQDVVIKFENEGDVSVENIGPVLNIQDGVKSGFSATNPGTGSASFYVQLNISSISDTLLTDSFKYALVRDVSGGTDYDYDNPVASGDFSDFYVGTNIITSSETIEGVPEDSTDIDEIVYTYQFIVYIDGNMPNDVSMQENSMEATLVISDVYSGYLNGAPLGSYVAYSGDTGCTGESCNGQNANYVSDSDLGYCWSSSYKFSVNGWRIAYQKDGSAYLISAGAPECINYLVGDRTDGSSYYFPSEVVFGNYYYSTGYTYNENTGSYTMTGISSGLLDWSTSYTDIMSTYKYTCKSASLTTCYTIYEINSSSSASGTYFYEHYGYAEPEDALIKYDGIAQKYCNPEFAPDGVCSATNVWNVNGADFELIMKQNYGMDDSSLATCYSSTASEACGMGLDLIDIGGLYWFSKVSNNGLYAWGTNNKVAAYISTMSIGIRPVVKLGSKVKIVGGTGTANDPYIIENEEDITPSLTDVAVGSYVSYEGNNGCPDGHCDGTNANYVDETNQGYCFSSYYKFDKSGWQFMYSQNNSAYLISAGSPECVGTLSSEGDHIDGTLSYYPSETTFDSYYYATGYTFTSSGYYSLTGLSSTTLDWASNYESIISTYKYTCRYTTSTGGCYVLYEIDSSSTASITYWVKRIGYGTGEEYEENLNAKALTYCNSTYAYNGTCDSSTTWAMNSTDYDTILANDGLSGTYESCIHISSEACGSNNSFISLNSFYWIATMNPSSLYTYPGVAWYSYDAKIVPSIPSVFYGLRPVIKLASGLIVTGGVGTQVNPYTIAFDSG